MRKIIDRFAAHEVRVRCNCGAHEMRVVLDKDDYQILEVCLWQIMPNNSNWRNFRQKVAGCWQLLRYGEIFNHGILLRKEEALKLSKALIEISTKMKKPQKTKQKTK